MRFRFLFAVITTTFALTACAPPPSPAVAAAAEPELEMAVYDAPGGSAQQLRSVLQQAFARNEQAPPVARATVTPDGRILVVGPKSVQRGVAELFKSLKATPPAPPRTIEIKYWLVLGKPGGDGAVPKELNEISAALQAVSSAQGGLSFEPLESLTVRSLQEEWAEANGRTVNVKHEASVGPGGLIARIQINPTGPAELHTRVMLEAGQTLVLGESGFEVRPGDLPGEVKPGSGPDSRKLFYVVRPTLLEATKTP